MEINQVLFTLLSISVNYTLPFIAFIGLATISGGKTGDSSLGHTVFCGTETDTRGIVLINTPGVLGLEHALWSS